MHDLDWKLYKDHKNWLRFYYETYSYGIIWIQSGHTEKIPFHFLVFDQSHFPMGLKVGRIFVDGINFWTYILKDVITSLFP